MTNVHTLQQCIIPYHPSLFFVIPFVICARYGFGVLGEGLDLRYIMQQAKSNATLITTD